MNITTIYRHPAELEAVTDLLMDGLFDDGA